MKLIENSINSNLNLKSTYPNITKYIFDNRAIKFYKLYSLDRNQIIYADVFDSIFIVIVNTKHKIKQEEIEFVIHELLPKAPDSLTITKNIKENMEKSGIKLTVPCRDIVFIKLPTSEHTSFENTK